MLNVECLMSAFPSGSAGQVGKAAGDWSSEFGDGERRQEWLLSAGGSAAAMLNVECRMFDLGSCMVAPGLCAGNSGFPTLVTTSIFV